MGMFTSIIHPKDGRELQIKTRHDSYDTYKIGDKVNYFINKDYFGHGGIFDGVYESYSDKGVDDWVIIKGHKVIAVRSLKRNKYPDLIKQYKIRKPSKNLWTKRAYAEHLKRRAKSEKDFTAFEKSLKNVSPAERIGRILAYPLSKRRDYSGMVEKAFSVLPMTPAVEKTKNAIIRDGKNI